MDLGELATLHQSFDILCSLISLYQNGLTAVQGRVVVPPRLLTAARLLHHFCTLSHTLLYFHSAVIEKRHIQSLCVYVYVGQCAQCR